MPEIVHKEKKLQNGACLELYNEKERVQTMRKGRVTHESHE